jgi:hypothetical protein
VLTGKDFETLIMTAPSFSTGANHPFEIPAISQLGHVFYGKVPISTESVGTASRLAVSLLFRHQESDCPIDFSWFTAHLAKFFHAYRGSNNLETLHSSLSACESEEMLQDIINDHSALFRPVNLTSRKEAGESRHPKRAVVEEELYFPAQANRFQAHHLVALMWLCFSYVETDSSEMASGATLLPTLLRNDKLSPTFGLKSESGEFVVAKGWSITMSHCVGQIWIPPRLQLSSPPVSSLFSEKNCSPFTASGAGSSAEPPREQLPELLQQVRKAFARNDTQQFVTNSSIGRAQHQLANGQTMTVIAFWTLVHAALYFRSKQSATGYHHLSMPALFSLLSLHLFYDTHRPHSPFGIPPKEEFYSPIIGYCLPSTRTCTQFRAEPVAQRSIRKYHGSITTGTRTNVVPLCAQYPLLAQVHHEKVDLQLAGIHRSDCASYPYPEWLLRSKRVISHRDTIGVLAGVVWLVRFPLSVSQGFDAKTLYPVGPFVWLWHLENTATESLWLEIDARQHSNFIRYVRYTTDATLANCDFVLDDSPLQLNTGLSSNVHAPNELTVLANHLKLWILRLNRRVDKNEELLVLNPWTPALQQRFDAHLRQDFPLEAPRRLRA